MGLLVPAAEIRRVTALLLTAEPLHAYHSLELLADRRDIPARSPSPAAFRFTHTLFPSMMTRPISGELFEILIATPSIVTAPAVVWTTFSLNCR